MLSNTRFRDHLFIILVLIALMCTACGALQADPTPTSTPSPTPTPEPTPTTAPTAGPGPAFTTDVVMEIPGVAQPVGKGACKFAQADEPGMILTTINGIIPVENGETCFCCLESIVISPNLRVPLAPFFAAKKQAGISMTMNISLKGPMAEETGIYILSGPEGASLHKEGAGFRLVNGLAFYIEK
jgi:hypothetical protein